MGKNARKCAGEVRRESFSTPVGALVLGAIRRRHDVPLTNEERASLLLHLRWPRSVGRTGKFLAKQKKCGEG